MPAIDFPERGLTTQRLVLRQASQAEAHHLVRYQLENRSHVREWEPLRDDDFFTPEATQQRLAVCEKNSESGAALHLWLFDRRTDTMLGLCNFTSIIYGPFQACFLGFSLAARAEGQGLMHEALDCALQFMFREVGLHRVMANHRPENLRSQRLLSALGFEAEGLARSYLKINGRWTDHVLTSKINPAD